MDKTQQTMIIIGAALGVVILIAIFVLLYVFVFSKRKFKKQIRDIERKYSYLDALLIGQDSQYIHRLEVISHTNLLYVDKHETFQKRFKEIYDNDDKYADSLIKQLNSLTANNQYKNIKSLISDARKAVSILEDKVNKLNDDLYEIIRLEEDCRKVILKLKEDYRAVKQIYFTNVNDLEYVSGSITKVFDKLDSIFAQYESHIEGAEYDEADALIPTIKQVTSGMDSILKILPNLVSLIRQVVPSKIEEIENFYHDVKNKGLPLYHLSCDNLIKGWKEELKNLDNELLNLKVANSTGRCQVIIKQIEETETLLAKEVECKKNFELESGELYKKVKTLDDSFLKVCSLLPEVNSIYVIEVSQKDRIELLKENINKLWATKRNLDGFIHSETKQPYSTLYDKLTKLNEDYDVANTALKDFRAYLDSLKISCEEAFTMINVYYYRAKQVENTLRIMALPEYTSQYAGQINHIYDLLNEIDQTIKHRPIDVAHINEVVEELKGNANDFFDVIEDKYRDCLLAESAIVYANRDRQQQSDVHQSLSVLENSFYSGDFDRVYSDANAVYNRSHIESNNNGRK